MKRQLAYTTAEIREQRQKLALQCWLAHEKNISTVNKKN